MSTIKNTSLAKAQIIAKVYVPSIDQQNIFSSIDSLEEGEYVLLKLPSTRAKKKKISSSQLKEAEKVFNDFLNFVFKDINCKFLKVESSIIVEIKAKKNTNRIIGHQGKMANSIRNLVQKLSETYEDRFLVEFVEK